MLVNQRADFFPIQTADTGDQTWQRQTFNILGFNQLFQVSQGAVDLFCRCFTRLGLIKYLQKLHKSCCELLFWKRLFELIF